MSQAYHPMRNNILYQEVPIKVIEGIDSAPDKVNSNEVRSHFVKAQSPSKQKNEVIKLTTEQARRSSMVPMMEEKAF